MYQALIFDLDGTLLDTIRDITEAINQALSDCGYTYRYDKEGTKSLIGDGVDMLIARALKEKKGDGDAFSRFKSVYMPYYLAYQNTHTSPFDGILEALKELKDRGVDLYIVSNKPDHLVKDLIPKHFGDGLFKEFFGQAEGEPVKPDPHLVNRIIKKYGYSKDEVLYVGDSLPDVLTAENAKVDCALCTWGYGKYDDPRCQNAKYRLSAPKELLSLPIK